MVTDSILIKKILVPIDGSDLSYKAARYAMHLAKADNAEVTALNVIEGYKTRWCNWFAGEIR
jgi:nucleotide-binding universal stress UspA family protein